MSRKAHTPPAARGAPSARAAPDAPGDLSPEEFRRYARRVADWTASYLAGLERYPVMAQVAPGEIAARLPPQPPDDGEPFDAILRDIEQVLLPGITHWNHPGFHAYFANTASVPGILAESLTAAFNANAMLWRTAPAATELEAVVLAWLRQMMGLPASFDGHINDTASISTLVALAAAREVVTDGGVRERGLAGGPRLTLYASQEAHSSVEKAAIVLGLGQAGVRKIDVDPAFRMDPASLAAAIARDRRDGCTPMAVVATVGTTSTTSVDPVAAIADICAREDVWLHVDAAYGGAMAIVPEYRWVLDGCARADSLVVNPHKWLFVPMDLSVLYCRRPEAIRRAFALVPAYLMTPEDGLARNLMDYGPALGRRFRALKLWMVIRTFGARGMAQRVRGHVELARQWREWIEEAVGWEVMAPAPMSTVLFRHHPDGPGRTPDRPARLPESVLQAHNEEILRRINASGRAFLSHTMVQGRFALRLAVGNLRTQRRHLASTWKLLRRIAAELATPP
jgi:aromatic-L-amino-acid decarboxylase